jgi:hypothetical protein
MPFAAPHPCKQTGCSALVERGKSHCEQHEQNNADNLRWRNLVSARGNSNARGYDSHYRRWRALYFKRNVMCSASCGCNSPATELHHIHPVSDVDWYKAHQGAMTDESNVQGLCSYHHRQTGNRGGRV